MTRISFLIALMFVGLQIFAQSTAPKMTAKEENDPAAKTLLDKVRKKYEAYKSLEMDFSLSIEVPGQPTETQKGSFKSLGVSKFRLDMTDQTIISDGKTTWIYLKKNNEVQITDADTKGEQSLISPNELMKIYQKGEYNFAIVGEEKLGEKTLTQIEFKPINKKSEYSKLKLAIDKKSKQVASIKAFAKDGGRYTFSVSKQTGDKVFDSALFTFDKSKFPKDVKIEDLRM